ADLAQLVGRHRHEVLAAVEDATADGRVREARQPDDRLRSHALARARLADDAERLLGLERQRDALDRAHHAVERLERDAKVVDLEERHQLYLTLGSRNA